MGSKYFRNSDCEYFPCHNVDDPHIFNCLFCYCPLYQDRDCPGNPEYIGNIKDCSECDYPHKAENYYNIVDHLVKKVVERKGECNEIN